MSLISAGTSLYLDALPSTCLSLWTWTTSQSFPFTLTQAHPWLHFCISITASYVASPHLDTLLRFLSPFKFRLHRHTFLLFSFFPSKIQAWQNFLFMLAHIFTIFFFPFPFRLDITFSSYNHTLLSFHSPSTKLSLHTNTHFHYFLFPFQVAPYHKSPHTT